MAVIRTLLGRVKGDPGHTPVKGVDYWTDADKEAIVQEVITALGTPVFGTVDENNIITLSGALTDGAYTLKYEDGDGNQTEIGSLEISSNADSGYTNLIDTVGFTDGQRLSNSTGTLKDAEGYTTTGFIEFTDVGDVFRTSGVNFDTDTVGNCICSVYDSNQTFIGSNYIMSSEVQHAAYISRICDSNGNAEITVNDGASLPGYIRICGYGNGANLIVTKNEEIV